MAKRGNTKALDAFRRQVKHIQRSTGKSYRAAQKQASAEHKHKGHKRVSGTKRKRKARPRETRVVQRTVGAAPRKRGGSTVKEKMKNIQEQLAKQLGVHEMKRIASNTRKAFNYHGKKISEIRSQIRRLC